MPTALRDKRYLILDNDSLFTAQFKRILGDAGVQPVLRNAGGGHPKTRSCTG